MAPIEYPEELSRGDFLNLVQQNQSIMVIKFGAEWCKPCQRIKSQLNDLCSDPSDVLALFNQVVKEYNNTKIQ